MTPRLLPTVLILKANEPSLPIHSIKMQLFLRAQNTHTLEVTGQETVREIKVRGHAWINQWSLWCNWFTVLSLQFHLVLLHCLDLSHACKLFGCIHVWSKPVSMSFGLFQLHVQTLEGLLMEDQVLLLDSSPLEDSSSLVDCGISEYCTLEVAGRLLGGQYSGSRYPSG